VILLRALLPALHLGHLVPVLLVLYVLHVSHLVPVLLVLHLVLLLLRGGISWLANFNEVEGGRGYFVTFVVNLPISFSVD
jgi:hypothetical protein